MKTFDNMAWTTGQEISFINGLGSFSNVTRIRNLSRRELFSRYIAGANKRVDWGRIDTGAVMDYAKKELEKSEIQEVIRARILRGKE